MEKVMQHKEQFVFVEPPKEDFIPWYDSLMHDENLPHYLNIESPDPFVMQNRYTTDDGSEMILLSNSHRYDSHTTKSTFDKALTHKKRPQIWDLQTGERFALPLKEGGSFTFDLGPAESILIVFEKGWSNRRFMSLRGGTTKQSSVSALTLDGFVPRNDEK